MKIPENLIKVIDAETWDSWNEDQKEFILKYNNQTIDRDALSRANLHSDYSGKTWDLGKTRPEYGESCNCKFSYCFYAEPRNWSMSSSSDVWNLMKCANNQCGKFFESCL